MKKVMLVLVLVYCMLGRVQAQLLYNNPWGEPTILNIIDGPESYATQVIAFDDCIVNMSGAYMHTCSLRDNSRLNFSGGLLGYKLEAWQDGQIFISGGEIGRRQMYTDMVQAIDRAQIFISGGIIYAAVTMNGNSRMDISGGRLAQRITASENSRINIFGGQITSRHSIWVSQTGIVTFYGCNFMLDGVPIDYGTYSGEEIYKHGTGSLLTGTLKNVGILKTRLYTLGDWARIVFVEEPVCCSEYPVMDFNEDCKVDFTDLAIFAQSWLKCNLIAG